MNSLLVKAGVPQMRCKSVIGGAAGSFSYEVIIDGEWMPCNYQFAAWWVGYVRQSSQKVTACRGVVVHVVGFDRAGDRVIFMRAGYPHECAQPTEQFRRKFKRVL